MFQSKYSAIICEGSAEEAILNILLDNNLLIIERKSLIEERVLRCRNARTFEQRYLGKSFNEKITIYRILDSHRENFKLSKEYQHQVKIVNVVTAPEIEMLIIFHEDKYNEYKKSGKKPSAFCKENLCMKNVKQATFVKKYFSDPADLVNAIKKHHSMSRKQKNEMHLFDLLKQ